MKRVVPVPFQDALLAEISSSTILAAVVGEAFSVAPGASIQIEGIGSSVKTDNLA